MPLYKSLVQLPLEHALVTCLISTKKSVTCRHCLSQDEHVGGKHADKYHPCTTVLRKPCLPIKHCSCADKHSMDVGITKIPPNYPFSFFILTISYTWKHQKTDCGLSALEFCRYAIHLVWYSLRHQPSGDCLYLKVFSLKRWLAWQNIQQVTRWLKGMEADLLAAMSELHLGRKIFWQIARSGSTGFSIQLLPDWLRSTKGFIWIAHLWQVQFTSVRKILRMGRN